MSKFNLYRIAKALDPRAWEKESNPARLRQHQDSAWTPYGNVMQKQDQKELYEKYSGVHFAFDAEQAAIYAEIKATKNDPPVLIEVYRQDLPMKLDVDAEVDLRLQYYLEEKRNEWQSILDSDIEDDEKVNRIFEILDDDKNFWVSDTSADNIADLLTQENTIIPPVAIENYLNENQGKILQEIQSLATGKIPESLIMRVVGQFRVMHPIMGGRVKAIYLIPFINLNSPSGVNPWDMSEEELEESGWTKNNKGEIIDEEGRLIISYEDAIYNSWLNKKIIYNNKQMDLPGMEMDDSNTVWHGTTLNRAKQAFPELLGQVTFSGLETEAKSNIWYKASSGYDWVKNKMREDIRDKQSEKYPFKAVRINNYDQPEPIERLIGEWVYAKTEAQARAIFYKKHPWLKEVSSFNPEYDEDKYKQDIERRKKKDKKENTRKEILKEQIQEAYWNK